MRKCKINALWHNIKSSVAADISFYRFVFDFVRCCGYWTLSNTVVFFCFGWPRSFTKRGQDFFGEQQTGRAATQSRGFSVKILNVNANSSLWIASASAATVDHVCELVNCWPTGTIILVAQDLHYFRCFRFWLRSRESSGGNCFCSVVEYLPSVVLFSRKGKCLMLFILHYIDLNSGWLCGVCPINIGV